RQPTPPRQFNRDLPAEVATIALKAIEKEPARRYQSAGEMADDLRRYLDGLPISARPPSSIYYLRKLVARNKLATGLGSSLFIAVTTLGITSTILSIQYVAQRDQAIDEARRARSINYVFTEMLKAPDPFNPESARDIKVADALDRASSLISTELEPERPIDAGLARVQLGITLKNLLSYEPSEREIRAALALFERAGKANSPDAAAAWLALGETTVNTKPQDAEPHFRRALELLRRAEPANAEAAAARAADMALTLNNLGVVRKRAGDREEAGALLAEARELWEDLLAQPPKDADAAQLNSYRNGLGQTLNNQASLLLDGGDPAEVRRLYERALELRIEALGADHIEVAKMRNNFGKFLLSQGDTAGAERLYEAALATLEERLGNHPWVCLSLLNLCDLRLGQGRVGEARGLLERAEAVVAALPTADAQLSERLAERRTAVQAAEGAE
ncbi:MAG: tetratricopeptide repeat protein, partial [Phycisphaerales bacterium]|nr:tetratricopeptide repeat protein [Phycisphaerales bacterium]